MGSKADALRDKMRKKSSGRVQSSDAPTIPAVEAPQERPLVPAAPPEPKAATPAPVAAPQAKTKPAKGKPVKGPVLKQPLTARDQDEAPKFRLPDGAKFDATYDAAKGAWTATLTVGDYVDRVEFAGIHYALRQLGTRYINAHPELMGQQPQPSGENSHV